MHARAHANAPPKRTTVRVSRYRGTHLTFGVTKLVENVIGLLLVAHFKLMKKGRLVNGYWRCLVADQQSGTIKAQLNPIITYLEGRTFVIHETNKDSLKAPKSFFHYRQCFGGGRF